LLQILFSLLGTYLFFALGLSLSVTTATYVTDIVSTVLLSCLILRLIEIILQASLKINLHLQLCMEVSLIALLLPSILLECISIGFRSFSLGFRLFANVSAGHVLSDILLASRYAATTTFLGVLWHFSFSFFILAYETVVATIQLGVFISLTTVYTE